MGEERGKWLRKGMVGILVHKFSYFQRVKLRQFQYSLFGDIGG